MGKANRKRPDMVIQELIKLPDRLGPARKLTDLERTFFRPAPLGQPGDGCQITFGHNATDRKVLMAFSVATPTLVFNPEDARGVGRALLHYADMADGRKTQA
jgi:hypothetical protein